MQSQTALVRTESGVELDTITAVDLRLKLVVFPDYAELDDTLRDGNDLEGGFIGRVLFEEGRVLEGGCEL